MAWAANPSFLLGRMASSIGALWFRQDSESTGSRIASERGTLYMAMTLAMFCGAIGACLSALAYSDAVSVRLSTDSLQEIHFLRSEAGRGEAVISGLSGVWDYLYLPLKKAQINTSHSTNTYFMKTRLSHNEGGNTGYNPSCNGFKISSLAKVKRGSIIDFLLVGTISPISRYAEKYLVPSTFASIMYFTENNETTNGTPSYFWGPDILEGRVQSNSDIWIKQGGGGANNGWPTFHGPVYTAGQIQSYNGAPPYGQVFRAGYWEHVSPVEFDHSASLIRQHGNAVGEVSTDAPLQNTIMYVTLNGGGYMAMRGQIITSPDTADVWQHYPPAAGNYLYRNRFAMKDTIWTNIGGGCLNHQSAIVYSKLWLKGAVTGRQTWCSTDTLYIVDDITYTNTQIGLNPDGGQTPNANNRTDYLGIVSEKSILIQYGFKDPVDSLRKHPNCGSDHDGIFIYGALCALGRGNNSHEDGVFSFEYQHPHPSNPDQYVNGVLYSKIDLHKHKFPQSSGLSWPGGLDYPWFNPLWPESHPYMERGTAHVFGVISQRRAGYLHRSASDPDYPNPEDLWNIPLDYCGGASGLAYNDPDLGIIGHGINATGATGNGVGYKKDYHYDKRLAVVSPPDFPMMRTNDGRYKYINDGWYFKSEPGNF